MGGTTRARHNRMLGQLPEVRALLARRPGLGRAARSLALIRALLSQDLFSTRPYVHHVATAADLTSAPSLARCIAFSLFGPIGKVLQIRRPLALLGGHQLAIGRAHVDLALDLHIGVT